MTRNTLIAAVFRRHKMRTLFTVLSIVVAFAVYLVLAALHHGLNGMVNYAQAQRMNVTGENGHITLRYASKIAAVSGIAAIGYQTWWSGYFREPKNVVSVRAVSFKTFPAIFPEFHIRPRERQAMENDRQGAIAGAVLAKKMGWKVGQTLRIKGGPPQMDGSTTWEFHLRGIAADDMPTLLQEEFVAHYDYINEGRTDTAFKDTVGSMLVMAGSARDVSRISHAIDDQFASAQPTTLTLPDALLASSALKSFGDVGAILTAIAAAVFISMLLIAGNTMSGSVRERMNEFALMRALGFSRSRLAQQVFREAVTLIGLGAATGLILGGLICEMMRPAIAKALPWFFVPWQAVLLAGFLALLFAFMTGVLPAHRVTRMVVADTLRRM